MSGKRKEAVNGDRFVVMLGQERAKESTSRGVCLSFLQGRIDHAKGDAAGTVVFEPVIGEGSTVYLVSKRGRTTRTQIVNDII